MLADGGKAHDAVHDGAVVRGGVPGGTVSHTQPVAAAALPMTSVDERRAYTVIVERHVDNRERVVAVKRDDDVVVSRDAHHVRAAAELELKSRRGSRATTGRVTTTRTPKPVEKLPTVAHDGNELLCIIYSLYKVATMVVVTFRFLISRLMRVF